jgi:cell division protein FtsZ
MINVRIQPQQNQEQKLSPKIKVIGVGGAGGNAVNNMIATKLEGVEFISCNTDAQALSGSLTETRIQLGHTITGGLGAGANPEIGRAAAEESIDEVSAQLEDANMVFVTCGMGGGTGTGAAPVIARAAREKGILTVGVVTKPFHFEGAHRMRSAEAGIEEMQQYVDTLIVIPNQNLFRVANEKTTFAEAFKMADTVLQSGVRGVTDLMVMPGLINLDFADVRTVMLEMGKAMMGTGEASGERRAIEAAEKAINNPLLDDVSLQGAQGVIINITGGYDMTLFEADEACNRIRDEVDADAKIIFGSTFDETLEGSIRVSIVATGIEAESARRTKGSSGFSYGGVGKNSTIGRAAPKTSDTVTAQQNGGFATHTQPVSNGVIASAPVKTETVATNQYGQAVGVREGGSYIPPRPVEAAKSTTAEIQGMSYPAQNQIQAQVEETFVEEEFKLAVGGTGGAVMTASPTQAQTQSYSAPIAAPASRLGESQRPEGLVLNPPKMPVAKKRPQSLFERFTTGKKAEETSFDDTDGDTETTTTTGGGSGLPSFTALRADKGVEQGHLNIEQQASPAAQPVGKPSTDDLDIPAFLRRQAN